MCVCCLLFVFCFFPSSLGLSVSGVAVNLVDVGMGAKTSNFSSEVGISTDKPQEAKMKNASQQEPRKQENQKNRPLCF